MLSNWYVIYAYIPFYKKTSIYVNLGKLGKNNLIVNNSYLNFIIDFDKKYIKYTHFFKMFLWMWNQGSTVFKWKQLNTY